MDKRYYRSGNLNGFHFEERKGFSKAKPIINDNEKKKKDEDLIIEENTIYEIDRECYERLKKQRKR